MSKDQLDLPPLFSQMAFSSDANLPGECLYRARRGRIDAGTVCYSERLDQLDALVMLAPETPLGNAIQVIYPLMLAANDALGATLPAGVAVHLGWPDRILVNSALAGGIGLLTEETDMNAVPNWMLARFSIDVMGNPGNPFPGAERDRTSLYEEGAGEVTSQILLESFCRYFLNWLDTWQRGGMAAIREPWMDRAAGRDDVTRLPGDDGMISGLVTGLTDDADLIFKPGADKAVAGAAAECTLPLPGILTGPSWEI